MPTMINDASSDTDISNTVVSEPETGIFEYMPPQTISKEKWLNEHLDCDAIIDNLGQMIVVYAFTKDPEYNFALGLFYKKKNYTTQQILMGISSDGLNSLF